MRTSVGIIAFYELRLLMRGWTFRFLALAGACIVLAAHFFFQCIGVTGDWDLAGLPGSVPFLGTYLLGFVQVLVLFFAGGNFAYADRNLGTREVFYVRPVENSVYVASKILGICLAILLLEVGVLLVLLVMQLLFSPSPLGILAYVFYLLTLLLPSLVFWSGMAAWVKSCVPHRGLALLLLIGGFVVTYWLAGKGYWGIDVMGHEVPNVFSGVTGSEGMAFFLFQRLAILLMGGGIWCFAAAAWGRIPNSGRLRRCAVSVGGAMIFVSFLLECGWWWAFRGDDHRREFYRECQMKWEHCSGGIVSRHDIRFERDGEIVKGESDMILRNSFSEEMPELVFYLNPGLEISCLEVDGAAREYMREGQVVVLQEPLAAGDSVRLLFRYRGEIDERVCYLDISDTEYHSWWMEPRNLLYRSARRYGYVGEDYTLLTPECLWYPSVHPPVRFENPLREDIQFTRYSLRVRDEENKLIISQGRPYREGKYVVFEGKHAYPGLSLTIGDYERRSTRLNGTVYELFYFRGHDFFTSRATPEGGLRKLPAVPYYDDVAGWVGAPDRIALVESPLSFWAYERVGRIGSEYVQAEIVYGPERGIGLRYIPFGKKVGENMLPDMVLISLLWDYWGEVDNHILLKQFERKRKYVERVNRRNVNRMLSDLRYYLQGDSLPGINTLLRILKSENFALYGLVDYGKVEAMQYMRGRSYREVMEDEKLSLGIKWRINKMKADELERYVTSLVPAGEWERFLVSFFSRNLYQNVTLEEFCGKFEEEFGIDLMRYLAESYVVRELPFFQVRDVSLKAVDGEVNSYIFKAKVWNRSPVAGRILMLFKANNPSEEDIQKIFLLKAGECKELRARGIGIELNNVFLCTNLAQNIPGEYGLPSRIIGTTRDTVTGIFDIDTMYFASDPSEIITDNRDAGFNKVDSRGKAWLTRNAPARKSIGIDQNMVYTVCDSWQTEISIFCYGDTIQDMHYMTATGKGNYAEWNATLPEDGMYEVWVFNPRNLMELIDISIYNYAQRYTVYAREKEIVEIDMFKEPQGWVKIGKYDFKAGAAKVVLHDDIVVNEGQKKRNAFNWSLENDEKLFPVIFADAVKWVRVSD